jgi:hypothetical protein
MKCRSRNELKLDADDKKITLGELLLYLYQMLGKHILLV